MAMQWDPQAVRAALAAPGEKTSRRLLSELCEDFRREKPEEWKRIEAASYSEPDCAAAQRAYRRASAVSTALLVLALAVVIAAFVLGDFGAAFLTGWATAICWLGRCWPPWDCSCWAASLPGSTARSFWRRSC